MYKNHNKQFMKSKFLTRINSLKKNNINFNICDHATVTITNKALTQPNKINFIYYFLAFLNITKQTADINVFKKKYTSVSLFKLKSQLKNSNAEKFLKHLSSIILPNRQKFKKYSFDKNSNIISFHIDDWLKTVPFNFPAVNSFNNQLSMQVVIVLNKKVTTQEAFMFLSSLNFPIIWKKSSKFINNGNS